MQGRYEYALSFAPGGKAMLFSATVPGQKTQLFYNEMTDKGRMTKFKSDDPVSKFYVYRMDQLPNVLEDFKGFLYKTIETDVNEETPVKEEGETTTKTEGAEA